VAYYADLTPYIYWETSQYYSPHRDEPWPGVPVVNVGWLDAEHPCRTGVLPEGLLARLKDLAGVRVLQTRGYHYCELCIRDLGGISHIRSLDAATRDHLMGELPCESAEFRVKGSGVVYAVPQLALHYIAAHGYLPPPEFCDAITTSTEGSS